MEVDKSDTANPSNENQTISIADRSFDPKRLMAMSGYILVAGAAGLLIFLAFKVMETETPLAMTPDESPLAWTIQHFGFAFILLISAALLGGFGIRLLGAAGKGTPTVIPPDDRELLAPLIEKGNEKAISQYVILSSLSGFTGTFQKIGFTGLPLATVGLTLIFSMLSFYEPEFLELAKLTLGAFIGSFVQKGRDAPKLPDMASSK